MKVSRGFTVIELLVAVVFLASAATILLVQRNNLLSAERDDKRKIAVNAMHYSLEEVYFAKNQYYPAKISAETLPSVDPDLFTDPNGQRIDVADSEYRYEPTGCNMDGKCRGYSLRADLEKEADYVKSNR